MGRCIALIIGFTVPYIAGWLLIVLIAMGLISGPIGWAIIAAILAFAVSLFFLWWAFKTCGGK